MSFSLLLAAGLWFLNLTLFHIWAAGGPPSPRPEWHLYWSKIFAICSLGGFVAAGVALGCCGLAASRSMDGPRDGAGIAAEREDGSAARSAWSFSCSL